MLVLTRVLFFDVLQLIGSNLKIASINLIDHPIRRGILTAVVKFANGEEILMVPSDAIALALTQGSLGKVFHLYVDIDHIKNRK